MLGQEAVREGGRDRTGREVLLASAGDVDAHPRPARYLEQCPTTATPVPACTARIDSLTLRGTIPSSFSGDEIQIRVGGEFVMPDATAKHKKILFVAGTLSHGSLVSGWCSVLGRSLTLRLMNCLSTGGVGINPLIGMMRELHDTDQFTLPGTLSLSLSLVMVPFHHLQTDTHL